MFGRSGTYWELCSLGHVTFTPVGKDCLLAVGRNLYVKRGGRRYQVEAVLYRHPRRRKWSLLPPEGHPGHVTWDGRTYSGMRVSPTSERVENVLSRELPERAGYVADRASSALTGDSRQQVEARLARLTEQREKEQVNIDALRRLLANTRADLDAAVARERELSRKIRGQQPNLARFL